MFPQSTRDTRPITTMNHNMQAKHPQAITVTEIPSLQAQPTATQGAKPLKLCHS